MNTQIETALKTFKRYSSDGTERPPYTQGTLNSYITNYNKLNRLINETEQPNLDWITLEKIKPILIDKSPSVKKNYLNAVIIIMRALNIKPDELAKIIVFRDELIDPVKKDGIFTEKQSENVVEKKEILDMIKQIKKEITFKSKIFRSGDVNIADKNLFQLYTILKIYENLPIRNEIATLKHITASKFKKLSQEIKDKENWLVTTAKKYQFFFNNYKTANTYGLRIVDVPNPIKLILQKWIKIKGSDNDNLFIQRESGGLTNNNLTKMLNRASQKYLGKNISTVLLRKIFYSEKYSEMKKEIIKDAQIAGHSPTEAMNGYVN